MNKKDVKEASNGPEKMENNAKTTPFQKRKKYIVIVLISIIVIFLVLIITNIARIAELKQNGETEATQNNLGKSKEIENLEIKDIKVETVDEMKTLNANVLNNGEDTSGDFVLTIYILNKEGARIAETAAYINKIEPGEETPLQVVISAEITDVYDIEIIK